MKRRTSKKNMAVMGILSAILIGTGMFASQASFARKVVTNGGQIRFCENQTERWTTYPASGNHKFFHQEVVLGEGSYSISMIPNGNFAMNAFVYGGDDNHYLGGKKNTRSYVHNFRVGDWAGEKFLVQLVKLSESCRGCSVTMVLKARHCPKKTARRRPAAPSCPINQCLTDGGLFGIDPQRCVSRPGARGGPCVSPGN